MKYYTPLSTVAGYNTQVFFDLVLECSLQFKDFGLDSRLMSTIEHLGFSEPTEIQQKAIPAAMTGQDLIASSKTGSGKTLAFIIPAMQRLIRNRALSKRDPRVLILMPTRELAKQVFTQLRLFTTGSQFKAVLILGGENFNDQVKTLEKDPHFIVATPGRLADHLSQGHFYLNGLELLILDEADRMLDLGFKEEIDQIMQQIPQSRQTLLFSATFDDSIHKFSKSLLKNPQVITIDDKTEVADSVEQLIYTVDADRKRELLSYLIGSKNWQQVLIFTRTKKTADELAKEICKDGIKAQSLHGDKSQGARDRALLNFKQGKVRALVATDVAARGIDIVDLEYVVNYELPYVAEDYVHRIGRTGRAGKSGLALSLVSPNEEWLLTAIEKVIDDRLLQQWLPGYEPDLTKDGAPKKSQNKKKARNQALQKPTSKARRRR